MRPDRALTWAALLLSLSLSACAQKPRPTPDEDPCVDCHAADAVGIKLPRHDTKEVDDACEDCHTQDAWAPAQYDHDKYWPLVAAGHKPGTTTCSDCHPQPEDPKVYTCTTCKDHAKSETDADHAGVAGYTYQSVVCVACHPKGVK